MTTPQPRDLDDRLRGLADTIYPSPVNVTDDLSRGRAGVRRHRLAAAAGSLAVIAVMGVGAVALGGDTDPAGRRTGFADNGSLPGNASSDGPGVPSDPPPGPSAPEPDGKELLQTYRDVLAEYLDPTGEHLQKQPDNLQTGDGLGTKLGWTNPGQEGLGLVQVFVGPGWESGLSSWCDTGATCSEVTVDGIKATVAEQSDGTSVLVERADGVEALITVDLLFGNNSSVPVGEIDLSQDDLVRAAADERLAMATLEQERNAGPSMGFPDFP